MKKERMDRPFTRYEELCRDTYRDLHSLTWAGHYNLTNSKGEGLYIIGWEDPRQINHGYSRGAYGISIQILSKSLNPLQEGVHVRSIRIEIVHDQYHYKDTRYHYVARELKPRRTLLGKDIYVWEEIPEKVAQLKDNWFTELREKIKSFR